MTTKPKTDNQDTAKNTPVQVITGVNYALHSLGWKAFQDLCVAVISNVLGQSVQGFLPVRDGGRDGAFYGRWDPRTNEELSGAFVVQCKFSAKLDGVLRKNNLRDEFEKATRLAKKGMCDNYVLMTNLAITGAAEEEIREAFEGYAKIKRCLCLGSEWITAKITESSRLRMLVPRVYGLGDLSQILDERKYQQANAILASMREDLVKFVITDAYRRAAKALIDHGFVVLLGEPAAGKSSIGACLALGALDEWGCSTMRVRDAEDFEAHWNPHEQKQFFWIDDAFGTTQFQRDLADGWNRTFPALTAAIRGGARVLFTSRDYVFRAALSDLKTGAFPLLQQSQVIINVQDLQPSEREQILYNHVKLGSQPKTFRKQIKRHLKAAAANPRFLPEIARRLGSPVFTKNLQLTDRAIQEFIERPMDFLVGVLGELDTNSRAAIGLVFMRGGRLSSPIEESEEERKALALMGSDAAGLRAAVNNLNGSLLSLLPTDGAWEWAYRHPTVGDAFARAIAQNPELLDVYLAGAKPAQLVREVVCGSIAIEGASVIVPPSRSDVLSAKLDLLPAPAVHDFLGTRCDQNFIDKYLNLHPGLIAELLSPGAYLHARPQVTLLAKLRQWNLVPADLWSTFLTHVVQLAVEIPDADFVSVPRIRSMFTQSELEALLARVRTEVIPRLSVIVDEWADNYNETEDPDSYLYQLRDALSAFRDEIPEEHHAFQLALDNVDELEQELEQRRTPDPNDYSPDSLGGPPASDASERDIFDDVDV